MRNVILIIVGFILGNKAFGTAQIPDRLIYNNDTIRLYSNPLESFYNEDNPRPMHFGVSGGSTACWRGYQATWEIKDNKLYLIEIADCHFQRECIVTDSAIIYLRDKLQPEWLEKIKSLKGTKYDYYDFRKILEKQFGEKEYVENQQVILDATSYLKPRNKADLTKLFGEHCKDGKVFAFWFSGDLIIPQGELIEYVHMGYMSKYEKELILTIEEGFLVDEMEFENKTSEIEKGFGYIQATSYSMVVPIELISEEDYEEYENEEDGNKVSYLYTMTDTMSFSNIEQTYSIEALAKFNEEKTTSRTRKILVEGTIDSLSKKSNNDYVFSNKITEKFRYGTASWIDGFNNDKNERIRIFTMSNINSQMIMYYKEKGVNEEDFVKRANYITYSVQLMEFGY